MKQVFRALLCGLCLLVWSGNAQAQIEWFVVTAKSTGIADTGQMFVMLTDNEDPPAFNAKWFLASSGVEKEMLATALTAMSLDMNLWVRTDPTSGTTPVMLRLYLRNF